jgi:hypothetical protein
VYNGEQSKLENPQIETTKVLTPTNEGAKETTTEAKAISENRGNRFTITVLFKYLQVIISVISPLVVLN